MANDPNIVSFLASDVKWGEYFLVMEFAPLGSLLDQILADNRHQVFTEQKLLSIRLHISAALLYLHTVLNIIHGDIKPENILVFPGEVHKIGDFGFSNKRPSPDAKVVDIFPGSAYYAAPELYNGEPYIYPVDMWALGILLYLCSTGKDLWAGYVFATLAKFMKTIEQTDISKLYDSSFESSSEYDTVNTLLRVDPDERATAEVVFNRAAEEESIQRLSRMRPG
jgi:NIMA (never in mitosis gene a)-related kinase